MLDTSEYIRYRLCQVGVSKVELFSSDAIVLIHEASSSILRDIDRIATACCVKAVARRKHRLVDREFIVRVLDRYQSYG